MGVVMHRDTDTELYQETHDEVQRLLSISEAVRITIEVLSPTNKDFAIDTIKPDNNSFKPKVLEQPKASKNTVAQQSNKVDDKAKAPEAQQPTDRLEAKDKDKEKSKEKEKEPTTAIPATAPEKLTTAKLAKSLGLKTPELKSKLMELGYLEEINGEMVLSEAGRKTGGESRKGRFGEFCVWDAKMQI